jgi:hypothetical protein
MTPRSVKDSHTKRSVMFTCGLTKLRPMAMTKIGAGLLLSLRASPRTRSHLITVRDK